MEGKSPEQDVTLMTTMRKSKKYDGAPHKLAVGTRKASPISGHQERLGGVLRFVRVVVTQQR